MASCNLITTSMALVHINGSQSKTKSHEGRKGVCREERTMVGLGQSLEEEVGESSACIVYMYEIVKEQN